MILPFLTACNFLMKKWDLSFCGAAGFYIYTVSMNLLHFEILAFVKISFFCAYGFETIHLKVNILLLLANG